VETPLTPLDFARRTRRLHGSREAVADGDLRLSYEQFFDRCDRWSAALQGLGTGQGDRVATIAPNTHAQLESFYAVPQTGAVLVPVNYRLTAEDFVYIVNHSGASVVCADRDYLDAVDGVRDQMPDVKHFVAFDMGRGGGVRASRARGGGVRASRARGGGVRASRARGGGVRASRAARDGWVDYEAAIAAAAPRFDPPVIGERDLLTINYTSGTTARPKGVMITHRNAAINTIGTLLHLPIGVGESYLWTLPMFHANGWTYTWTVTAAAGTHICLRKVDPAEVFRLIREENVTWLCAAPTVLISLASASPAVRGEVPPGVHVVTAGAPPAAATIERLEGEFGWEVTHVYGLTETAPFITVCAPLPEHEALSPGDRAVVKARQGVELLTSGELRVVDDAGTEVIADGQHLGEIVVRGNVVMDGYYNDPEATERVMGDGWFHSGDAAVVHPDGYVEIRDRLKDVIISGGENISSVEVEGTLLRHPAVQEAAIVGLPHERWGEAPYAFVVLREGGAASPEELIAFTREHLAHFKAPHGVTFVDELPKTATGKIQKFVLRQGAPNLAQQ
jgi:acyl-CoA synthetase (AMP-forming)/AMP-acid ligase II